MTVPPPRPALSLLLTVALLCASEFLQSGMVAFGAGPIMGEIGTSPEAFSLASAGYTSFAVLAIAKMRWLVERLGWRTYVQLSTMVFAAGCAICSVSDNFALFLVGRCLMGLGGGAFMTAGRTLVHLAPGPFRFLGIRYFATGLAVGIASAPGFAALAVIYMHGGAIFLVLGCVAVLAAITASLSLPTAPVARDAHSDMPFLAYFTLLGGSFLTLFALQMVQYELFASPLRLMAYAGCGALGLWHFYRSVRRSDRPLLEMQALRQPHYIAGVALFTICYVLLGANNTMLPVFMQRGLGIAWQNVGMLQSIGLSAALVAWFIMAWLLPKRPEPRKFFVTGFLALACFGWQLSRLGFGVNPWRDLLPALAANGVFLMFVLATTAMQTFKTVQYSETILSHAQQLKNMVAQWGLGAGMSVAAANLQVSTALHATMLQGHLSAGDPALVEFLALGGDATQQLAQQATLLASVDYFSAIAVLGLIGALGMLVQRLMR